MSQLCSLGEKNYFVHIHILMKIFENLSVIILQRPELGNKMCMVTRSIQAWKDKKCISEPANCPTYKSADSLAQVCNLVYDLLTPSQSTKE